MLRTPAANPTGSPRVVISFAGQSEDSYKRVHQTTNPPLQQGENVRERIHILPLQH